MARKFHTRFCSVARARRFGPRTLQHIKNEFSKHGVPAFTVHMHERDAFRAIFSFGGTLEKLDRKMVRNIEAASANARALATEVVSLLRPSVALSSADGTAKQPTAEVVMFPTTELLKDEMPELDSGRGVTRWLKSGRAFLVMMISM